MQHNVYFNNLQLPNFAAIVNNKIIYVLTQSKYFKGGLHLE